MGDSLFWCETTRERVVFTCAIHRSSVSVLLFLAAPLMLPTTAANAAVWYVTPAGAGERSGTSWSTACAGLQAGVDKASSGDEVWVMAGSYAGTGGNTGVVTLKSGVTLYGGFQGSETTREQRNWADNVTIIYGGDARRCVYTVSGGSVDGFTMTGGKTTSSSTGGPGGAGMFGGTATNCVFTYNTCGLNGDGGGIYQGTAINCVFTNNTSSDGGGLYKSTAMNCTVAYNSSDRGGGLFEGMAINCIIWGNMGGSSQCYGAIVTYSLVATEPGFINPTLGDFRLRADSPCIDTGTSSGAPLTDLAGTVRPNGFGMDMGAYEYVPYSVFVPSVDGYPEEAATTAIREADLTLGKVTQTFDDSVPSGSVISQNPAGGAEAVSGSAVDLVMSKGPQPVGVPDVVGQTQASATALITEAGLTLGMVTEAHNATVPAGQVINQNPAAGASVPAGSAVALVISKGPTPVAVVPDVVGQTQASAITMITEAGLTLGTVTEAYSETVGTGRVIRQNPAAGASVPGGSVVDLMVSKGKASVVVIPNVLGMTQAAAATALTGVGLMVGAVTEAYSATVPASQVISQTPVAGTSVPGGSAASLVVSKGPEPGEGEGGEGEPPLPPTAEEVLALLAAGFNAADTNGDGRISYAEALAAIPGLTLAVFNELDTDGDGALARAELGLDAEPGCFGCQKSGFTLIDLKKRMGDLFLAGLALSLLAVVGRRKG